MRWLIDEMLPPATATELEGLGHDAEAVAPGTPDELVYGTCVETGRVLVTENSADFATLTEARVAAGEATVAVVFVRKRDCTRRGGLAASLARRLHRWAEHNPDPYPGVHWP